MAKRSQDAAGLEDSKKVKKDKSSSKDHKSKDKKDKKEKKSEKSDSSDKSKKSKKEKSESKKDKKEKKSKKSESEATETPAKTSTSSSASASDADVKEFLETNGVGIEVGQGIANCTPVLTMDSVPVNDDIKAVIKEYPKPTPIQSATWPYLIQGNDVIGVAETGSGKTMAFGVPAAQKITSTPGRGVRALIISPTRELAMQIDENLAKLKSTGVSTACVYGGVPKYEQKQAVKKASIVAGTPGRLKDLIGEGSLDLSNVEYLVLDEADRMLEKGFEQDIKEIIGAVTSSDRQTVMFTATWPPQVRELAASFMKPAVVKVSIGDADELTANKRITQIVEVIDPQDKERKFIEVLQKYTKKDPKQKILVFALYKKEATRIERLLNNKGYRVAAVHGDLNQTQRTQALDDFKKGKSSLMLATDVAARGLDIPAVKVVINLTFPLTAEDYVHRIGRTGRAGQTGIAHTLFTEHEKHLSGALINVLNGANQPVPDDLLKFGSHTKKKEHSLYGAFFKDTSGEPMPKAKKIKFD